MTLPNLHNEIIIALVIGFPILQHCNASIFGAAIYLRNRDKFSSKKFCFLRVFQEFHAQSMPSPLAKKNCISRWKMQGKDSLKPDRIKFFHDIKYIKLDIFAILISGSLTHLRGREGGNRFKPSPQKSIKCADFLFIINIINYLKY